MAHVALLAILNVKKVTGYRIFRTIRCTYKPLFFHKIDRTHGLILAVFTVVEAILRCTGPLSNVLLGVFVKMLMQLMRSGVRLFFFYTLLTKLRLSVFTVMFVLAGPVYHFFLCCNQCWELHIL